MRATRRARRAARPLFEGVALQAAQTQSMPPTIRANGVTPNDGTTNTIQPGEWISIYGTNLAGGAFEWSGNFPTSLGGVQVEINGRPAYLTYVSPTQINAQAPDDDTTGAVSVTVTTSAGTATSSATLAPYAPAFSLIDGRHVAAIILRNGSGAYGDGSYDILGPTGDCFGYFTAAANPGDTLAIFAVGLGPTDPAVAAGAPYSGAAPITNPLSLYINGVPLVPSFVGLSEAGLYQINVTLPPGLGFGDVPILATIGAMSTQPNALISLGLGAGIPPA